MEKPGATPGLRYKTKKTRNREATMDFVIGFIAGMKFGAFIVAWRCAREGGGEMG